MDSAKLAQLKAFYHLDRGLATRAIHAGEASDLGPRAHVAPIHQTSAFTFESAQDGAAAFSGERPAYIYTRMGNPTVRALEAKLGALEGGTWARQNPSATIASFALGSGMAAIATALLAACSRGDTILIGDVLYAATEHLCLHLLKRLGVTALEVDCSDPAKVEPILRAHPEAKALLFETPVNPTLGLADIRALAAMTRRHAPGARIMVDNTFATPCLQQPLALGADVVLHSTTKYIGGHGTTVGGAIITTSESFRDAVFTVVKDVGAIPSPFDAWLTTQGLKTLPLRMERHGENALAVARFLEGHPQIARVHYPGLESFPQHALAQSQMQGFGGMVSFELKGGLEAGRRLMDTLELWTLAVSLGTVDSLIQHPASMTHASVPKAKREEVGIRDGLVRASVGLEEAADLIGALEEALARL